MRFAVVGNPVAHSLSPQIHAAFARQTGREVEYLRILAPHDGFVATAQRFLDDGGRGINVTVPFKLEARAWCGERVSARAMQAGAVNCVRVDDDGVFGDNTDGVGLVDDLRRLLAQHGLALDGARILLLGAGGAARGVIGPLVDAGPRSLVLVNRDRAKAEALAAASSAAAVVVRTLDTLDGEVFDVVVNATSASLGGAALVLPATLLSRAHLVYDMMYGATATAFLVEAARAGATGSGCWSSRRPSRSRSGTACVRTPRRC
jgi:shikimate dehydrogenase